MTSEWKRPTSIGMADKLQEITKQLAECLPKILDDQITAIEGMAKLAIAAEKQKSTTTDIKREAE